MTHAVLEVSRSDCVAVMTSDILDRHTFPHELCVPLRDALAEFNADESCRCIVFCFNAQTTVAQEEAPQVSTDGVDLIAYRERAQAVTNVFRDLMRGPKPLIAAVEAHVRGAGLSLVAACDHVISAENASFRCDTLSSGLLPDMGLLWNLPQKVGTGKAQELILMGSELDAKEAQKLGLVSTLVPPGQALTAALALARRYDAIPLVAVGLLRAALVNGAGSFDAGMRQELDLNPLARESLDHAEAVGAFLEKRQPNFVGN